MDAERRYLTMLGARILSAANDLKRTPEALALELGIDAGTVRRVLAGEADLDAARALIDRMRSAYPISMADLWLERPDATGGVVVMTAEESRRSARVFSRRDGRGQVVPYLEYRDTAMSRTAPYRPEWVKALRVVEAANPEDPAVAFNNGHLMHQLTFFVGEVNAYWRIGQKRFCAELRTGDSTWAAPYVPHSFTSRSEGRLGVLLAVTYAGEVRHALEELARLGSGPIAALAGDLREPGSPIRALVRRYRMADGLSTAQLARRLAPEVGESRAELLAEGAAPLPEEVEPLASALGVRRSELSLDAMAPGAEFVVCRADPAAWRPYPAEHGRPAYLLRELARTPLQPGLRGLELTVLRGAGEAAGTVQHHLHEYVYNHGDAAVDLHWDGEREARLGPGDSAYVEPLVPHRFVAEGEARLLVVRVQGAVSDPVLREIASYAPEGRARLGGETMRWF